MVETNSGADFPKRLIIGVGNDYRGDDAAGLLAARRLMEFTFGGARVVEAEGEASGLMELWEGAEEVIIIDAVVSGGEAGAVYRFDAAAAPLPRELFASCSTHSFSLAEAVELARALGRLPKKLVVFGIEGRNFETGAGVSAEVERGIERAAGMILGEIA